MDWKCFDRARRNVGPVHLDLVESYAQGRSAGATSSAGARSSGCRCRSSAPSSRPAATMTTTAAGGTTGHRRPTPGTDADRHGGRRHSRAASSGRLPEAGRPARPDRHAGPRRLRHHRPVLRVPRHARRGRRHRPGPRRVVGAQRGRQRLDVQPAPGRQVAGRHATSRRPTSPPRWTAWSPPATPASRASSPTGAVDASDPATSPCSPSTAPNGNFPYLVSVFNAQTLITPVGYETGTTLDAHAERHRPLEARPATTRHRRHVRAQPRLVGRPDAARRQRVAVLRRRRHDGDGACRAARSTPSCSSRSSVATRCSTAPTSTCSSFQAADPPPDLDALRHRPVRRQGACARRSRYTFDREQMIETLFQGQADLGNDHVIAPFYPFFDDVASPQRDARTSRWPRQLLAEAGVADGLRPCSTPASCRRSPSSPS